MLAFCHEFHANLSVFQLDIFINIYRVQPYQYCCNRVSDWRVLVSKAYVGNEKFEKDGNIFKYINKILRKENVTMKMKENRHKTLDLGLY